jgi:hypothetical protein
VRGPRARYRRWAYDVPEGSMPRDWRLHPIRLYRSIALQRDDRGWRPVEAALRDVLGLKPRFRYRVRLMPWGHRGRYDQPLALETGRRYICPTDPTLLRVKRCCSECREVLV